MKTFLFLGLVVLVGCSHSPGPKAPESYTITETTHECHGNTCQVVTRTLPENGGPPIKEVTVKPIEDLPRTQGQVVSTEVVEEDTNPYAEEERNDALLKAMKEAVERDSKHDPAKCMCTPGDPLCSCL